MSDDHDGITVERRASQANHFVTYGLEHYRPMPNAIKTRRVISVRFPNDRRVTVPVMCTHEPLLDYSDTVVRRVLCEFLESRARKGLDHFSEAMLLYGAMEKVCAHALYHDRSDRELGAVAFFLQEYAQEIESKTITLNLLRAIDPRLSEILRQPRYYTEELAAKLPKGRSRAGRPMIKLSFDPATLDPADERDRLVLQALRKRTAERERHRAKAKAPSM